MLMLIYSLKEPFAIFKLKVTYEAQDVCGPSHINVIMFTSSTISKIRGVFDGFNLSLWECISVLEEVITH